MRRHEVAAACLSVVSMGALAIAGLAPATPEPERSFDPDAPHLAVLDCPTSAKMTIDADTGAAPDPVESIEGLTIDAELLATILGGTDHRGTGHPSVLTAEFRLHDVGHAVLVEARRPADGTLGAWMRIDYYAESGRWILGSAAMCADMVE